MVEIWVVVKLAEKEWKEMGGEKIPIGELGLPTCTGKLYNRALGSNVLTSDVPDTHF